MSFIFGDRRKQVSESDNFAHDNLQSSHDFQKSVAADSDQQSAPTSQSFVQSNPGSVQGSIVGTETQQPQKKEEKKYKPGIINYALGRIQRPEPELREELQQLQEQINNQRPLLEHAEYIMRYFLDFMRFFDNKKMYNQLFATTNQDRETTFVAKEFDLKRGKKIKLTATVLSSDETNQYREKYQEALESIPFYFHSSNYRKYFGKDSEPFNQYFALEWCYQRLAEAINKDIDLFNKTFNELLQLNRNYSPYLRAFPNVEHLQRLLDANPTQSDLLLLKIMIKSAYEVFNINKDAKVNIDSLEDDQFSILKPVDFKKNIAIKQILEFLVVGIVGFPVAAGIGSAVGALALTGLTAYGTSSLLDLFFRGGASFIKNMGLAFIGLFNDSKFAIDEIERDILRCTAAEMEQITKESEGNLENTLKLPNISLYNKAVLQARAKLQGRKERTSKGGKNYLHKKSRKKRRA